jgi:hypothetical protein
MIWHAWRCHQSTPLGLLGRCVEPLLLLLLLSLAAAALNWQRSL